jgi:hypothetical protein
VARKHFREEAIVGPTEREVSKPPINRYLAAVSDDYKLQCLGQKMHTSQRSTARYLCPVCREPFQQEPKLWQHAMNVHPEYLEFLLGDTDPTREAEAEARKRNFRCDLVGNLRPMGLGAAIRVFTFHLLDRLQSTIPASTPYRNGMSLGVKYNNQRFLVFFEEILYDRRIEHAYWHFFEIRR